jgi:hypothetical protein
MFLQILWSFKGLLAKVAFMRLERYMHANMRSDVIAFHGGCSTGSPSTGQIQIVCGFPTNVSFTNMVLFIRLSVSIRRRDDTIKIEAQKREMEMPRLLAIILSSLGSPSSSTILLHLHKEAPPSGVVHHNLATRTSSHL